MGKIVHIPSKREKLEVIQISKDKIMINGVECKEVDLEEFIMGMDISPEAGERFVRGLLEIIKEECSSNWKLAKMFKEVFKTKK